jgi:2-hydroxycyclohexanecarboxyl-CoA dehydrogenase
MENHKKVVIVTGSGRGIGQAIALKFAEQQGNIIVVDRIKDRAQETARKIEKVGGKALALEIDITDLTEVQEMTARTLDIFGRIDILVNNAGWDVVQPFFQNKKELWDQLIDINLKGCIYCCRVVAESMIEKKYGKIVNVSSDAGRTGSGEEAVYAAAKGGVIAFTKSLAVILAPFNINVNSVSPGLTDTPAVERGMAMSERIAEIMEKRKQFTLFKRWAQPEEIADAVLFLSSDAAKYITGQVLSVNGGGIMVD